eukprot:TRINITY_DN22858_c0_g1_i1.p1 TRINITY_DN22858_c0_g1~~TRINITY_DN22858_c0_g1_i1.p1  ORF type:complete len:574 (+),score=215.32 TRINITY_DN22858_c0_g1_i1:172-1893(+)
MCRWLVYVGSERILLADLVTNPDNSMIQQSFAEPYMPGIMVKKEEAKRLNHKINADGFGIGWYSDDMTPCVFTSIKPSWNDRNLHRLADTIWSKCVFAHVRAASPGSLITESNCHPFQLGRILFMHNGAIPNFPSLKRRFVMELSDQCYSFIQGSTDSEHTAALFVQNLPGQNPFVQHSCADMAKAMLETIKQILDITTRLQNGRAAEPCSLNFAVTNGDVVIATRFRNCRNEQPPSLYYTRRRRYECSSSRSLRKSESFDVSTMPDASPGDGGLAGSKSKMVKLFKSVVISSEPLTRDESEWELIPSNSMLIVTPTYKLMLEPIEIDDSLMVDCQPKDCDPNQKLFSADECHSPVGTPPVSVPWSFPDPGTRSLRGSTSDLSALCRAAADGANCPRTYTDIKNEARIVRDVAEIDLHASGVREPLLEQLRSAEPLRSPKALLSAIPLSPSNDCADRHAKVANGAQDVNGVNGCNGVNGVNGVNGAKTKDVSGANDDVIRANGANHVTETTNGNVLEPTAALPPVVHCCSARRKLDGYLSLECSLSVRKEVFRAAACVLVAVLFGWLVSSRLF